jgi:hypothetical protein
MEGQRGKNLVLSEWEFRVQKGVNQFIINDCMKKKARLSSKTMRHCHLTPRHPSADHSL